MTKPMTKRIESLLLKGLSSKEIVARLKCPPQQVYNARYYMKKRAEAARASERKKITIVRRPAKVEPVEPMPTEVVESPALTIKMPIELIKATPPKRSLWQRVVDFFA